MPLIRPPSPDYDVVIIGGGTAGCAAALTLKTTDNALRILVLEAKDYADFRAGETLPPQARKQLKKLGVWDRFCKAGHQQSPGISSCWGDPDPGYFDYIANPHGYGWHLDRARFDRMLADAVRIKGIDLLTNTTVVSADDGAPHGVSIEIRCPDNTTRLLEPRIVVDATGHRACFSHQLGIERIRHDRLIMVSAVVPPHAVKSKNTMALIEANEYGWWYSASLPDNSAIIGFFTDSDIARQLQIRQADSWRQFLKASVHTVKRVDIEAWTHPELTVSPAVSSKPTHVHGHNWLAIGDAAGSYDPLSAQGITKALTDGANAAVAITTALNTDAQAFTRYGNAVNRRYDNYLSQRQAYYSMEFRWRNSEFWSRRCSRYA